MGNEPKGPYRKGDIAFGYINLDAREAVIANEAWRAVRASRDWLVTLVLKFIAWYRKRAKDDGSYSAYLAYLSWEKQIKKALAEDEKEGK